MPLPGQAPPQQRPQEPPCYREFAPLQSRSRKARPRRQACDRAEGKPPREEACALLKRYSEAEGAIVKYIKANATTCGIPAEADSADASKSRRTLKTSRRVLGAAGGPARPTGPGPERSARHHARYPARSTRSRRKAARSTR